MTILELAQHYQATENYRGLELIDKLLNAKAVRFLENDQDEAIRKDFERLDCWDILRKRSYVNSRGMWVICPPLDA